MAESSILSAQRQAYIAPQATNTNIDINQYTLQELMILNDKILTKWRQSTPNLEHSLQDLQEVIRNINLIMDKLHHARDNRLLEKYQPAHRTNKAHDITNHTTDNNHIKHDYRIDRSFVSRPAQNNNINNTTDYGMINDQASTQVNNIAHNIHNKHTNIAKQSRQKPLSKANQLTQNIYNRLSQDTPQTPSLHSRVHNAAVNVNQHSFTFQSDNTTQQVPKQSQSDIDMKIRSTLLGNYQTPEVLPNVIDLIVMGQLGRINAYDAQLLDGYKLIQARNNLLGETQNALNLARANKPQGAATAAMPAEVIQFMLKQKLSPVPTPTVPITSEEYESHIQAINNLLTQYNSESQLELLQLQRIISYRNQSFEIISNTISRIIRNRDTIIGNIR